MKAYNYPAPSMALAKWSALAQSRYPRWRPLIVLVLLLVLLVTVPLSVLLVRIGNIGHAIGGWSGFHTRSW